MPVTLILLLARDWRRDYKSPVMECGDQKNGDPTLRRKIVEVGRKWGHHGDRRDFRLPQLTQGGCGVFELFLLELPS